MNDNSAENRQQLEAMYACLLSGDLAGFLAGCADDVVTHQSPMLPYGGVYHGKKALEKLLSQTIFPLIDGAKIRAVAPLMAGDDRVIASFAVPATRTGKELTLLEQATVRDGKVIELKVFYFDPSLM